ncbi:hypothetical protein A2U01_0048901, partial [Trifolium medium]|nr:hypothetical protein [Trifolium medium]
MDSDGIEESRVRLLESGNNDDDDYESNVVVESRWVDGSITKRLFRNLKRHDSLDVESMEISVSHPHHHHHFK